MTTEDTAGAEVYSGVGRELRDVRETMGLRLEDVSANLRIQYNYLAALEEGRYADLPGAAYALGFLRTYGNYLGLDAVRLIDEFKDEQATALKPKPLQFPQPLEKSRRAPVGLLIAVTILAAGVFGAYLAREDLATFSVDDLVPPVPERLAKLLRDDPQILAAGGAIDSVKVAAEPISAPPPTTTEEDRAIKVTVVEAPRAVVAETDPSVAITDPVAAVGQPTSKTPSVTQDKDASEDVDTAPVQPAIQQALKQSQEQAKTPPPPAPPAPPVARVSAAESSTPSAGAAGRSAVLADARTQTFGGANRGSRIVLLAREDSWIQVKSVKNELLITRVLQAGDRYLVPDRDDLLLTTGNAGGLDVIVDGKVAPNLGEIGKVARDIVLQPAKLLPQ